MNHITNREVFVQLVSEAKKQGPEQCFSRFNQIIPDLSKEELTLLIESYNIYDYIKEMFVYLTPENLERSMQIVDFKFIDYLDYFTNLRDQRQLEQILKRLDLCFPDTDQETHNLLEGLEAFLDKLLSEPTNDLDQIACWQSLKNFVSRCQLSVRPDWIIDLPDGFELKDLSSSNYVTMEQDKYDSMAEDQIELFRYYGPINRRLTVDPVSSDEQAKTPCGKIGCRMFNCFESVDPDFDDCYEYDFEDPNRCDSCGKLIVHNSWALREPLAGGGWGGWFCREKCLRRLSKDQEKVDILLRLLKRYGIYHR